jgi:hypothetical protein
MNKSSVKMGDRASIYWSQLKAMIVRNILLKKREKRKTVAVSNRIFRLYFVQLKVYIFSLPFISVLQKKKCNGKILT